MRFKKQQQEKKQKLLSVWEKLKIWGIDKPRKNKGG